MGGGTGSLERWGQGGQSLGVLENEVKTMRFSGSFHTPQNRAECICSPRYSTWTCYFALCNPKFSEFVGSGIRDN